MFRVKGSGFRVLGFGFWVYTSALGSDETSPKFSKTKPRACGGDSRIAVRCPLPLWCVLFYSPSSCTICDRVSDTCRVCDRVSDTTELFALFWKNLESK